VNGLEQEYRGKLEVKHIDIDDSKNRSLVARYQATAIPLMLVFDDQGQVVATFRGLTPAAFLREAVDKALAQSKGPAKPTA
jgi:thioredoxin-like negative regulator of GroEL